MRTTRSLLPGFCQALLLAVLTLLASQTAAAQTTTESQATADLPKSVVLVLKLVSANRVKPVTGVVVGDNGLVVVPADFITPGNELIVMDGGSDIVRNGRPGKPAKRATFRGLAVLSANGLAKPAILLAPAKPPANSTYYLAAFPPAEEIAQGAPPLHLPVELSWSEGSNGSGFTMTSPPANITGAIVDRCGNLVGLNLASGEPSPANSKLPTTILGRDLERALAALRIELRRGSCSQVPTSSAQSDAVAEDIEKMPSTPASDVQDPEPEDEETTATAPPEPAKQAPQSGLPVGHQPGSTGTLIPATPPSLLATVPIWLWIVGAAAFIAVLVKVVFFSGLLKQSLQTPSRAAHKFHPADSTEPDTGLLTEASGASARNPSGGLPEEQPIPDVNSLPVGFDGIVVIDGYWSDGSSFRRFCLVDTGHIDVVMGRGDADICIATAAISRRHVKIENAGAKLTLSDLGSSNGTFIRGIPCLPAEIMYIEADDEIVLGDIRLRISLRHSGGAVV